MLPDNTNNLSSIEPSSYNLFSQFNVFSENSLSDTKLKQEYGKYFIYNILATWNLRCKLDLHTIARNARNCTYFKTK